MNATSEQPAATAETPELPTIFQAFAAVKRAVGPVGKDGHNSQQNYNFRGIDAVVNAAAKHLDEQGVITVPMLQKRDYSTVEVGKNRTPMGYQQVEVTYRFYGPRGDYFDATVPGEAMDSGDKATAKAMSVAYRIALLQCLNLPTSDPDPDSQSYERSDADVDDGDWGEFTAKIATIGSLDDARALDKELKEAFDKGDVGLAKAKNIRAAIAEKVKTLPAKDGEQKSEQPKTDTAPADPELDQLIAAAKAAKTIGDLEQVRDDAKKAGKWSAKVPVDGGGTQSFSMLVQAQKSRIEQPAQTADDNGGEPADLFAEANAAVNGKS